jgi:hypothetical protein
LKIVFGEWAAMLRDSRAALGVKDKLKALFGPPA